MLREHNLIIGKYWGPIDFICSLKSKQLKFASTSFQEVFGFGFHPTSHELLAQAYNRSYKTCDKSMYNQSGYLSFLDAMDSN